MNAAPYNRLIAEMDRIWLLIPEADRYERKPSEVAEADRLRFAIEDLIQQAECAASPSPTVMAEIDAALARAVEHIAGVAVEGPKMPGLPAPRWCWYVEDARDRASRFVGV